MDGSPYNISGPRPTIHLAFAGCATKVNTFFRFGNLFSITWKSSPRPQHRRPLRRRQAVQIKHHLVYPLIRRANLVEQCLGAGALLLEMCAPFGLLRERAAVCM